MYKIGLCMNLMGPMMNKVLLYALYNFLRLDDTPIKINGTLLSRGTQVEKHWSNLM